MESLMNWESTHPQPNTSSIKFDVFSGRRDKKGRVVKVKSMGSTISNSDDLVSLIVFRHHQKIVSLVLSPEHDPRSDRDFIIYSYENLEKKEAETIGYGNFLTGFNKGLIELTSEKMKLEGIFINIERHQDANEIQLAG